MGFIAARRPHQHLFGEVRHVAGHLDEHDRFVEMIEIIGREPGLRVHVGAL